MYVLKKLSSVWKTFVLLFPNTSVFACLVCGKKKKKFCSEAKCEWWDMRYEMMCDEDMYAKDDLILFGLTHISVLSMLKHKPKKIHPRYL